MVGWELTTIFSYLLVGLNHRSASNRRAAQTALIVTTIGGLTMLLGVLLLESQTGTFSLAASVAEPPETAAAGWAAALMVVGALSKSAIVPFHWPLTIAAVAAVAVGWLLYGRKRRACAVDALLLCYFLLRSFGISKSSHEVAALSFTEDVRVDLQNCARVVTEVLGHFVYGRAQPEPRRRRVVA